MFPGREITPELVQENIAAINVYYDETKYTKIEEVESMGIEALLSSIGGTLGISSSPTIHELLIFKLPQFIIPGVFLGISFLSLVEFIELAIEVVAIARQMKKKSVQLTPKTPKS